MFFREVDKEKRRRLRSNMTLAEKYLWEELRKKQRAGYRFRRQFSIGGFVVDFYCMEAWLAVEVDGPYHKFTKEYDQRREEAIKRLGIRFLRFTNEEVIKNWDIVNLKIEKKLYELGSLRNGGAVRRRRTEGVNGEP